MKDSKFKCHFHKNAGTVRRHFMGTDRQILEFVVIIDFITVDEFHGDHITLRQIPVNFGNIQGGIILKQTTKFVGLRGQTAIRGVWFVKID